MSATLPLPDPTQPETPSAWARLGRLMSRRYRESWLDGLTPALPVRVLLADDQPIVREGLRLLLDAQPDIEVAGVAVNIWPANIPLKAR